jgi:hypothetical protein
MHVIASFKIQKRADDGDTARTNKESLRIAKEHFTKVYNRDDAPVDFSVLEDIDQWRTIWRLADPPTMKEMITGIQSMANNKAPGASGIPAEALKALPPDALEVLHSLIAQFWRGTRDTYEEWQTALLTILYKGKKDRKDLNNHRGIVLQDAFARLLSVIISKRLGVMIKECGIEEQFGSQSGRGTIDALFCLRTALALRKEHQQDTYVLFVDLIKAFDTANHDLLFELLGKYGAPPPLIDVIKRLHENFNLELKLDGKEKVYIDYTVGVRQGDNMAPVLFLFLMQAMAESYDKKRIATGRTDPEFRTHKATAKCYGRLKYQPAPTRTKGYKFNFGKSMFVDDTAYIAGSREELLETAGELLPHFRRFGLLMHVGNLNPDGTHKTDSKTEALFIPARRMSPDAYEEATKDLIFGDNNEFYVPFTDTFKYLGAYIHKSLKDDKEIEHRLKQASNQVGALGNFFRSSADLKTKRQIFLAIPVNTALYGCESWALTEEHRKRITGFYHKAARRILGINMFHVEEFHIRNEHVRNRLSVPNPLDIIRRRQFNQLGKFARLPEHRAPRQFIAAWVGHSRRSGGQYTTLRDSLVDSLQHVLGDSVTDKGHLNSWMPMTRDRSTWEHLSQEWIEREQARTLFAHSNHPLLGPGILEHKYQKYFRAISWSGPTVDETLVAV